MTTTARGRDLVTGFESVFRAEYARVVASVRWATGDTGAAEEAAQDAFCRALERWERVSRHENPGAWVQLTALRIAMRRRRRARAGDSLVPAWSPPSAAEGRDPDLERAIADLPRGQRAVVVLHHLLDLRVDDVAAVLGVSVGTVKTQLHRARSRLALALGEAEEVSDGAR